MVERQRSTGAVRPRRLRAAAMGMALICVMAACGSGGGDGSSSSTTDTGPLVIASAQGIPQLDPHKRQFAWEGVLHNSLWGSLVTFGPDNGSDLQPDLAETWEVSDDGRTFTFPLRDGLTFSTGEPLTAADVKGSLDRILDPAIAYNQAGLFPPIQSVTEVDESTVAITLESPSAMLLLTLLANVAIVDVSALDDLSGANPPTSGPFKVSEFVPDDHVTIVRNEHYWGEPAPSEEIRVERAQDASSAVAAMRSSDLDALWEVAWQDIEQLSADGIAFVQGDFPAAQVIAFGDTKSPPFDDVRVRQALVHATDKERIAETVFSGQVQVSPANVPLATNDPLYDDSLPEYEYDLDRAKELFAEAGLGEGSTITFWTSSAKPEWALWGQILQSDLAEIGITLEIQTNENNTWAERFVPSGKSFPGLLVSNQYLLTSPFILDVWAPGVCGCNYDNADYAAAIQAADKTVDPAEREALYAEAQRIFAETVPTLIIGQTSSPIAVQPGIDGVWTDPGNLPHFETARRTG